MLVQFSVENFMSFQKEVTFDMRGIPAYKEHETHLITLDEKKKYLRAASIYGANASGKSNFFLALHVFCSVIRQSLDYENPLKHSYRPYQFQKEKENTSFEMVFILEETEYQYGFEYNEEHIAVEWLYSKKLKTNRKIILLEREGSEVHLGASISKKCQNYVSQIPSATLALSFFQKLKLKTNVFSEIYEKISKITNLDTEFNEIDFILDRLLPVELEREYNHLLAYLKEIDTGIIDITMGEERGNIQFYTSHVAQDNSRYQLNLFEESEGTLKSLVIYIYAQHAIEEDGILFIDELNAKLHPLLMKYIIDLFYEKEDSRAQLIYSSHDTTLLDKKFLRRDQIWFVEKDQFGCSSLTSLAEYKIRSDASFEKDYLSGVYGGIAFLKKGK